MIRYYVLLAGLGMSVLGHAQNTKTIDIKPFSKVRILGCVTAELKQTSSPSLTVSANRNVDEARLTFDNKGDELIIRQEWGKEVFKKGDCRASDIKINLGFLALEAITTGVGAEVTVLTPLQTRDLDLDATTGSRLTLQAEVKNLIVKSVQGSVVTLSGTADEQQVTVNTGGELHGYDLNSEDAFVKANTGGVAQINVSKRLDAKASTGGAVRFKGNPAKKEVNTSLGGEVGSGK
ncbi:MAG: head GIN domain-containing protein [Siphonobacter sp.]